MPTSGSFYRDANRVPIWTDGIITKKSITFAGATTDAWGDDGGSRDGGKLFIINGLVYIRLVAVCTVNCAGAGSTGAVGIDGPEFMPTTTMTDLDAGGIWLNNATPAEMFIVGEQQAAADNLPEYMINGNNTPIVLVTETANTTAGSLDFYAIWRPISTDAEVKATTVDEELG